MSRSKIKKELVWAAVFLLLTALMINFLSDVLRPAQTSYGSTWRAFLAEPEDSLDVIYLGSSFTYCDVNPAEVYDSSGLTGFEMCIRDRKYPAPRLMAATRSLWTGYVYPSVTRWRYITAIPGFGRP